MNHIPRSPFRRLIGAALAFILALRAEPGRPAVTINELSAGASERLIQYDPTGVPQVGTGPRWYQATFSDTTWPTAPGPFGFGSVGGASVPIATNLQAAIQYLTPTTYFRKVFTVSADTQALAEQVQLVVEYNDGFVAYLNGAEVARRNGGPTNKFIYHDQPAYNRESFNVDTATIPTTVIKETISLGAANTKLIAGQNVLAIHLLNASATEATYYLQASLQIVGPVPLVNYNDQWKYLPGVVEPSGNVYDPTRLGSGKQFVPWGTAIYDDSTWSTGAAPFGYGSVGTIGTNTQGSMQNIASSLYTRVVFNVTDAQAVDPLALRLVASYDDGFVAYINGVEVCRRRIGLPNTFTPFDAVADSDSAVGTETITLDVAAKLLVPGSNVLAVQAHNYTKSNADFLSNVSLQTNGGASLVASAAVRKYRVGTSEPVTPPPDGEEEQSLPEGPDSATDWIELYNDGPSDVKLKGWHLTDDLTDLSKWTFPDVSIPAGAFLVVICDGEDVTAPPVGGYLHTNFKLDTDGEYLALTDGTGQVVNQLLPGYPRQVPFQSYARDSSGAWKYSDTATPAAANLGPFYQGVVAAPTPSVPGRFYTGSASVSLSSTTPGAVVRYTTDGTDPTAASPAASGAIVLSTATALRARAFLDGWLPSDVVTHTYLINQSTARRSLPAVCLTGDPQRAFYRPFGVFAIVNNNANNYSGGVIWSNHPNATILNPPNTPEDPSLYNAPMQSGKPAERPVSVEYLHTDARQDLRTGAFLRCAGSPYSRQRYVFTNQNSATPNSQSPLTSSATQKPQLNLFFRDDLGPSPLQFPLVPGSTVGRYENIRLRAGKNDITTPFIRDEFTRRLMLSMGQVTVRGDFVNVYLNGVFKGYYNICERPREPFFQEARGTGASFDVRNITVIADGDTLAYNELISFTRTNNLATYANFLAMQTRLDVVNLADYVILNAHAAMADWPGNNYVMDRERSANGVYRFSVWDAEGGYGGFSRNSAYRIFNDVYTTNISGETVPTKLLYSALRNSPEFRLLCADRIQKHFFNNGTLTDTRLQTQWNTLAAQIQPIMQEVGNGTVSSASFNQWISGQGITNRYTLTSGTTGNVVNAPSRRTALFNGYTDDTAGGVFVPGYFVEQGIWPATLAPTFNQSGGNVSVGYQLVITNPNATGAVYYTTNGLDPRQPSTSSPQGILYNSPVNIGQSTLVKARVRNASGEWSPLIEALFTTPNGAPVIISEIMYNPPAQGAVDGDEFEFLELHNTSNATVDLNGFRISGAIEYAFPAGATIAPGGYLVLARNTALFSVKYPGVTPFAQYGTAHNLNNSGELIRLEDAANSPFFTVTYDDSNPWPVNADGGGYSLVPLMPEAFTNPSEASEWRASRAIGGSPGANDASVVQSVYITEVLTNPGPGQKDLVELYNPQATPVDISDWWLSDSAAAPKKYRFPAGSSVPAGGFLTVTESAFNATPGVGDSFEFSKYGGEDVVLSSGDSSGGLTGYQHKFSSIPAAPTGVSLGRVFDSANNERIVLQSAFTPGVANSGPRVGPIVITELMYNAPAGKADFIELCNTSASAVPLFDPANPGNTWRILGLEYNFPPGLTMTPGQLLIVTAATPSMFRSSYGVSDSTPVYQYTAGDLADNGGEQITVQMPGEVDAGHPLVYIDVDSVFYRDTSPWSATADGGGASLERINWRSFGDDVANWRASAVNGSAGVLTPSTLNQWRGVYFSAVEMSDPDISGYMADSDRDGLSNFWEFALGRNPLVADAAPVCTVSLTNDPPGGPYLTLQYRRNLGASGVQYHVDTAGQLDAWTLDGSIPVGLPVNNGDGTETVTRRDTEAASSTKQRFIRFRIND